MVLEFLNKEDAQFAFNFGNNDKALNKLKNHPLFDGLEIHKNPGGNPYICVMYYSGLENHYVRRFVEIKTYDKYVRLIPQETKYEWITQELVNIFVNDKEYKII